MPDKSTCCAPKTEEKSVCAPKTEEKSASCAPKAATCCDKPKN